MTTHQPAPTRSHRGGIRNAVAALAALVVLVAGPPLALVAFVGNPIPNQAVIAGRLTDSAVIGMLAMIVWAAWAQLVLVILVEAVAAVRGGALPRRIPLCAFQQHLARRLVVTASLLLAGTGSIAAIGGASPAVAAVTSVASTRCPATTIAGSGPGPGPVVRAEHLRVGTDHVPSTAHVPLPSPTVSPSAIPKASAASKEREVELWYVVEPPHGRHHDSLWDIAERHLGDGMRWRQIYDLNRHRTQPDGQRLDVAKLIQPGWRLLMPADATGIHPHPDHGEAGGSHITARPETNSAGPGRTAAVPHARSASVPAPAALAPRAMIPDGAAPSEAIDYGHHPGARAEISSVVADQDDHEAIPFGNLTLGLTAFACAGIAGELARRRRRAQRFRRHGERLVRPGEPAAAAERRLRAANAELTVTALRDALRGLVEACREAGRDLPDVQAIRLNAFEAMLILGSDDLDVVAPFTATSPRTWTLPADLAGECVGVDPADAVDPYPALVGLGVVDDSVLLINLEAAGTLSLVGDPVDTRAILNALVVELGTSELSATAQLTLTGFPPEIAAMLDHGRVSILDPARASCWAERRHADIAAVLKAADVPDLPSARTAGRAEDTWAPAVLLAVTPVEAAAGQSGLSVVRVHIEDAGAEGWTLRESTEGWDLEPLGITLTPQRLSGDALTAVEAALASVAEPAGIPDTEAPPAGTAADLDDGQDRDPVINSADAAVDCLPPTGAPDAHGGAEPSDPLDDLLPARGAPRVLVLGPVEIEGVDPDGAPGRQRRATELIAYLALHPNASQHQLNEAIWPGALVGKNTRNPLVSRTRQWLGTNEDGELYIPIAVETGAYSLHPQITCDWHDFQKHAARGLAAGPGGVDDLIAALALVRGRPFLGVNPVAYVWAESDTQDMISAIVDVAHALAERSLERGDHRRARWAASRGLAAEACAELLYSDAIRAATAAGDAEDVSRLVAGLRRQIADLDSGDDMAEQTETLVRAALGR